MLPKRVLQAVACSGSRFLSGLPSRDGECMPSPPLNLPVSVKNNSFFCEPWSYNPAVETAPHPLICCCLSYLSNVSSSTEGCAFHRHR